MVKSKWKKIGLTASLSLALFAAGCGSNDGGNEQAEETTSSVSEELEYTITGIEPGAGQTQTNDQAIAEYESLAGWEQETSSAGAMLTALGEAIDNEEPIIVAAWSPHYMFAQYDIKYLEDPKLIFGEEEHITTIVRNGLKDDMPNAYTILDSIYFELPVLEEALLAAKEIDFDFETIAQQWVDENAEKVAEWTEGVEPADGASIDLVLTPWDAEAFTTNVTKLVLEQQGFDVTLTPVDPSIMFEAIASGDSDATLSPWMPATHGAYYEKYEGQFEDLGANVEGARIGLAVPSYMEIDSIEDLEPAE
ncbi:glycine/betaine ABC transporter [Aquibacillus koreensis]|uniref:Glycine/betaine ABC transporter n=1 Tax=Aquibacillus koreensis TaxID=279446 RepID=A0A9X3WLS1_9BACI|nr:glycine betaine ABC transporter substrate-binding protein [Aquibacillus koreensis]MCT2534884.1 glycine/betaine ABC transporter [Aquibacillus koreensis]MDC3419506.1 glycine/betaine ABC transporter [Aquibacillus koreensis]